MKGVLGPKFRVGPNCAAPNCKKFADHGHHVWRRSFLAGTYNWVELWDGRIIQNLVGLCWAHHLEITDNMSAIHLDDTGLFVWMEDIDGNFVITGKLNPQPRCIDELEQPPVSEECPTCGTKKRPKLEFPKRDRRKRKSWNLVVPDDDEDGAEVLDTLCDELAVIFEHDHFTGGLRRYYTVAQAFALVLQNQSWLEETSEPPLDTKVLVENILETFDGSTHE